MESVLDIFFPWGILALMIVAGIAAAIFQARRERQRTEALAALSADLGWRFFPGNDNRDRPAFERFQVFRRGHSRQAKNTLEGTLEIAGRQYPVRMGDYRYKITTNSGRSSSTRTYRFSYVIVQTPFAHTPDLLIQQQSFFTRIATANIGSLLGFGSSDVDFEWAEFNRAFRVRSKDKRFAYDVVTRRMMEFLMQSDAPTVDIEAGYTCITDGTTRWEPGQFRERLAWIERFFSLWPEHLKRALEDSPRTAHGATP